MISVELEANLWVEVGEPRYNRTLRISHVKADFTTQVNFQIYPKNNNKKTKKNK